MAQKDIFIEGLMAERFHGRRRELMYSKPSEEDIDEYIVEFAPSLMPQPLVLH